MTDTTKVIPIKTAPSGAKLSPRDSKEYVECPYAGTHNEGSKQSCSHCVNQWYCIH